MPLKCVIVRAAMLIVAAGLPASAAIAGTDQSSSQTGTNGLGNAIGGLLGTQNDNRDSQGAARSNDRRYDRDSERRDGRRGDRLNRDRSDYRQRGNNVRSDRRGNDVQSDDCRIVRQNGRRQRICDDT